MPDTKITALTALTAADPANDVLPIVDVSDTTMAASGTTKKISINNVLGASGTATLASATITGNLTVQTNKLFVNAGGAAVGTTSVFADFQVQRSTNARLEIDSASTGISYQVLDNARTGYLQNVTIASQHLWFNGASEAMRLNSTGLGVGGSPLVKLSVVDTVNTFAATFRGNLGTDFVAIGTTALGASINAYTAGFASAAGLVLQTNGGNVGIGVTPSVPLDVRGPFNGNHAIFTGTVNRGLVIATRSDGLADSRTVIFNAAYSAGQLGQFAFQIAGTDRILMKNNGQLRFVPLASDPAGAEAGDVYYNSTSNKLKCYNGTTWNDLF